MSRKQGPRVVGMRASAIEAGHRQLSHEFRLVGEEVAS